MYSYVFSKLKLRMHLSIFESFVLDFLEIAPPQLHPNVRALVRLMRLYLTSYPSQPQNCFSFSSSMLHISVGFCNTHVNITISCK